MIYRCCDTLKLCHRVGKESETNRKFDSHKWLVIQKLKYWPLPFLWYYFCVFQHILLMVLHNCFHNDVAHRFRVWCLKCRFDNKLCLLATTWHSSSVGTNSKQEWGHKNLASQSPLGPRPTDNQRMGREARDHIAILIMNEMAHERGNELGHLARLSRILTVRLCLRF